MRDLVILIPLEGESPGSFARRARETTGELLLVLSGWDDALLDGEARRNFFESCLALRSRARIAAKRSSISAAARSRGFRVYARTRDIKQLLADHDQLEEVLRAFSPHLWRQELRSRLQAMGLLSLPKIRIWLFSGVSILLFLFVLLRLFPSAEITVQPREDAVTHTVNIFLVLSGSTVQIPDRVRTMELKPFRADVQRTMTFDRISKQFNGTPATVVMTIRNTSDEEYSFRKGSRLTNQAGMIFRLAEQVFVGAKDETTVVAKADPEDLYGEIIGKRGNVPAGLRWDFPGLAPEEQQLVFAENKLPASGGQTSYRTVLSEEDLTVAEKQLQAELLALAKQMVDEELQLTNAKHIESRFDLLYYDELTKVHFGDFEIPRQFLGQEITSVPISGTINYVAYAYDQQAVLNLLAEELQAHVREGKRLLPESVSLSRLVAHVIDYADDLSWIKLTVDLTGTEQFILDPLSPQGARFAKHVRESTAGSTVEDALRIVKNLPEVDNAVIDIWPPWSGKLPKIPSHIFIHPGAAS